MQKIRVLFVEDSEDDQALLVRELQKGGFDPSYERVEDAEGLSNALDNSDWDIVISDHVMPQFDSFQALKITREKCQDIPFIVVSGVVGEEIAVEVMKAGANDYLLKDRLIRFFPAVQRELREANSRQQRELAEHSLLNSNTMKAAILEISPDPIISVDQNDCIVEWNSAAENTFGYSRDIAIGASLAELAVPLRYREDFEAGFHRLLDEGGDALVGNLLKLKALRANGEEFPMEIRVVSSVIDGAAIITGFARDMTDIYIAEERLRQAQKMEALGQLSGGIAHDFNNLLGVIMSGAELLAIEQAVNNDLLNIIIRAAESGAKLTSRLLVFSRQQPLRPKTVNVGELVAATSELLDRVLSNIVDIEINKDARLWDATVDSGQLETALLNIAVNARDAMPDGGRLSIDANNISIDNIGINDSDSLGVNKIKPGEYVMLTISDTGIGMPAEILAKAFDPFYTTKDIGKGTGLGLSMVYGFARQSGGGAVLSSEEGVGTTIKLYLPRASDAPDTEELGQDVKVHQS